MCAFASALREIDLKRKKERERERESGAPDFWNLRSNARHQSVRMRTDGYLSLSFSLSRCARWHSCDFPLSRLRSNRDGVRSRSDSRQILPLPLPHTPSLRRTRTLSVSRMQVNATGEIVHHPGHPSREGGGVLSSREEGKEKKKLHITPSLPSHAFPLSARPHRRNIVKRRTRDGSSSSSRRRMSSINVLRSLIDPIRREVKSPQRGLE